MKIWKWIIANTMSRPVWRIKYKDGRKTYLLSKIEAKSLVDVYGGRLYIDYNKGYF